MEQLSSSLDLRHAATGRVGTVVVPARRLFAIDGLGPPAAAGYRLASTALRRAASAAAVPLVHAGVAPPVRPAAEALWWPDRDIPPDELVASFADRRRWHWRQVIAIPDGASDEAADEAIDAVRADAGRAEPLIRRIVLAEGRAAQLLAIGGPAPEAAALAALIGHAASLGRAPAWPVHLIHLTEPGLVAVERQRTIVRMPVAP